MNTSRYLKIIAAFFAVVFILGGCKKPTDNITWSVDTDVYQSPILINFVNANINSTTALPSSFSVAITGQNANQVVVGSGGTDFTVVNGVLPLALAEGSSPSQENPVVFNVYASIPGFAPISQTFIVTSDTIPENHTVLAVEYANPPAGTSVQIANTPLTGGVSPSASIATSTNASMTETSGITIANGTQMMDVSGNLINASSLQTKVVHFGTATQSSMDAFPGGFNPVDVQYNGQQVHDVTFKTGGFLSIKMFAGNTEVKNFSQPISVQAELNVALINPLTNESVRVGDTIPIWSMNEQTGQWKYESTATAAMDANGKMYVQFQAKHLSCWNIDWWFYSPCRSVLRVNVHIPIPGFMPQYEMTLVDVNGQYLGGLYTDNTWATVATLYDGLTTVIPSVPNIGQARIVVYTRRGDPTSLIAETPLFNPCTQGAIDIVINPPAPPQLINIHLDVRGKCVDKNVAANVSTWILLHQLNEPWWNWKLVYVRNGQANFQLLQGATYYVETYYDGEYFVTNGVFNKNDANFDIGKGLTGTGTYNAATNVFTATLQFNIHCR